jgi:hypothetical protein
VLANDHGERVDHGVDTPQVPFGDGRPQCLLDGVEGSDHIVGHLVSGSGEVNQQRPTVVRIWLPPDEISLFETIKDVGERRPLVAELVMQRRDRRWTESADLGENERLRLGDAHLDGRPFDVAADQVGRSLELWTTGHPISYNTNWDEIEVKPSSATRLGRSDAAVSSHVPATSAQQRQVHDVTPAADVVEGSLELPMPPEEAFSWFTPEGERAWAAGWRPHYPRRDSDLKPGLVFVVDVHGARALWVLTDLDWARTIRYAMVVPDNRAGTVSVEIEPRGEGSAVTVRYRLTPMSDHGKLYIEHLRDDFPGTLVAWRASILAAANP